MNDRLSRYALDVTAPDDGAERISEVKRGEWFAWRSLQMVVTRVSRDMKWADLRCRAPGGTEWSKRQPLPLPEGTERRGPNRN